MHKSENRISTSLLRSRTPLTLGLRGSSIVAWPEGHPQLILALITMLGMILMLRAQRGHFVIMQSLPADPWTIAAHVYQGKGYTACDTNYLPFCPNGNQLTAMREPVPVLMFAGIMLIDPSPVAGVALEMLLYVSVIYLLYASLRQQGRVFALAAAALWALSLPVVQVVGDGTGDLEAAFWLAAGLLAFQKARGSHRTWHWVCAGLFLGLAALSRSVLLAVAGGLVVGMLFERGLGNFRSRIRHASTLVVVLGLTFAPWVLRNQIVFGAPIFGTTLTGYNLYRQNYIVGNADFHPHYVGAKEAERAVRTLVVGSDLHGNESEQQMQSYYMQQGLQLISAHPIEYLRLVFFRISALWFNSTVKAAYGERLDAQDAAMVLEQTFLLIASIVGAWLHRSRLWPFSLGVILSSTAYILVTAQVRYLVEILPLVVVIAASGLFLARQSKTVQPQVGGAAG